MCPCLVLNNSQTHLHQNIQNRVHTTNAKNTHPMTKQPDLALTHNHKQVHAHLHELKCCFGSPLAVMGESHARTPPHTHSYANADLCKHTCKKLIISSEYFFLEYDQSNNAYRKANQLEHARACIFLTGRGCSLLDRWKELMFFVCVCGRVWCVGVCVCVRGRVCVCAWACLRVSVRASVRVCFSQRFGGRCMNFYFFPIPPCCVTACMFTCVRVVLRENVLDK